MWWYALGPSKDELLAHYTVDDLTTELHKRKTGELVA